MGKMVSIVIPVYNEEESLKLLYEKIIENIPEQYEREIIFVNDGSTDKSVEVIKKLIMQDTQVHLISFRKNFGKAMALETAFRNAKGDIIITMDADLQDDINVIDKFIDNTRISGVAIRFDVCFCFLILVLKELRTKSVGKYINNLSHIIILYQ